jgi:DNA-binding transcriptional regulator YiaG
VPKSRPTVREQVQALIDRRHTVGSAYQMRARMQLAVDLGVSEVTVRDWQSGKYAPNFGNARDIQRLYDEEVGSNG